jgi:hypothetical protein
VGASKNKNNASRFSIVRRRVESNDVAFLLNQPGSSAENFAYETFGHDGVRIKRSIDDTESDLTVISNGSDQYGVAINDVVAFTHQNGLVTKAKVIDHYTTETYDNVTITKPADRVKLYPPVADAGGGWSTSNEWSNLSWQTLDGVSSLTIEGSGMPGAEELYNLSNQLSVGMNAYGSGMREGAFITSINYIQGTNNMSIGLSEPMTAASPNNGPFPPIEFINVTGIFKLDKDVWKQEVDLAWFNCYAFGNGVESDRIRDDFNAPQIDNGVRASSTFLEYGEEKIGSGMIYSGLYNSTSSINDLSEFNMAEKITKELNPLYGSIQAMKTRDTNIVVFTEDKVLKVLSNKDAVFNADGNPNLTASHKVLGQTIPFVGDYGISKNPESLAVDNYRMYFADKQRGAVLRLSMDGLTPISNVGMKSYFRKTLKLCDNLIGSFDTVNGEYNLALAVNAEANSCTTGTCPTSTPQPMTVSVVKLG